MYPAARELVREIRGAGAQTVFFDAWAHEYGWPENGLPNFGAMQTALDSGYRTIAVEQNSAVAPVGDAWWTLLEQEPAPGLWQDDGIHPTAKGTYLAACVFYATIFRQSPRGLSFHAGLDAGEAAKLQSIAARQVLGSASGG